MNSKQTGWIVFIGALGMMCGLMAEDIRRLMTWDDAITPGFIAGIFAHFSTVAIAFVAGKIIPESRSNGKRTRSTDMEPVDVEDLTK